MPPRRLPDPAVPYPTMSACNPFPPVSALLVPVVIGPHCRPHSPLYSYCKKRRRQGSQAPATRKAIDSCHVSMPCELSPACVSCRPFSPPRSHRKKRMRQVKKLAQRGLLDPEKEDPFALFVASTNIRYCYYHETQNILGNTYGMAVLQVRQAAYRYAGRSAVRAWEYGWAGVAAGTACCTVRCTARVGADGLMHWSGRAKDGDYLLTPLSPGPSVHSSSSPST